MDLDLLDILLLNLIQYDTTATVKEIAADVGLSPNACWRRIRNLEEQGYIMRRVALLDPSKLGVGTSVFVNVKAPNYSAEWAERFTQAATQIAEIVELHRMAGDVDFIMKLQVADIAHYDRVCKALLEVVEVGDISASFAIEALKRQTEIPLAIAQSLAKPFAGTQWQGPASDS